MKTLFTLTICFIFIISPIVPAKAQTVQKRNVPEFNGIKASGNIIVRLKKADHQEVKVRAHGIDVSEINTYVEDGWLKLSIKDGIFKDASATIDIAYFELIKINAAGGAEIYIDKLVQPDFDITVGSNGYAKLRVEVERISANLHSGGILDIRGFATRLNTKIASGAKLNAYDLACKNVEFKTNTGGLAEVTVSDQISGSASTGASVVYKGNPRIENVKQNLGATISRF